MRGRYRQLMATGKVRQQVITAVAWELTVFLWAIACEAMGKLYQKRSCKLRLSVIDLEEALTEIRSWGIQATITENAWGRTIN